LQSERVTKITDELAVALRAMQEIARRIAKISKEAKLLVDEDQYVQSFKVEFMEAVVQWCRGASFSDIRKVK
jgi:ATP-dependent RNA helicase DOB1